MIDPDTAHLIALRGAKRRARRIVENVERDHRELAEILAHVEKLRASTSRKLAFIESWDLPTLYESSQ